MPGKARLTGLDLARFLALAGMVLVNFSVVIGVSDDDPALAASFLSLFQGKAAALFVVLAGLGLGLAAARANDSILSITLRRAAFLFGLGMLNMLIFDGDILHYYGIWFLLAAACVFWPARLLLAGAILVPFLFVALVFAFDYEAGWHWESLTYSDLWTIGGFARHLLFNGWHPVVPWFAFMLWGLWLARQPLHQRTTQWWMIVGGLLVLVVAEAGSLLAMAALQQTAPELVDLAATLPIPPGPFYMVSGMACATLVTGCCLMIMPQMQGNRFMSQVCQAGRYSLTFYIAHIIVGMGLLEALGLIGSGQADVALVGSTMFVAGALVFAMLWGLYFRHGPIESVMRRITG